MAGEVVNPKLFKCFLQLPCNLEENAISRGTFRLHPGGNACNDSRAARQVDRIPDKGERSYTKIAEICIACPVLALELGRFGLSIKDVVSSFVEKTE